MQHPLRANTVLHPDMTISAAKVLLDQVRELGKHTGSFDSVFDCTTEAACWLMQFILETSATSRADIEIKLAIWAEYIEDPMCIFEWHQEAWRIMTADVALLAGIANQPDLKVAA